MFQLKSRLTGLILLMTFVSFCFILPQSVFATALDSQLSIELDQSQISNFARNEMENGINENDDESLLKRNNRHHRKNRQRKKKNRHNRKFRHPWKNWRKKEKEIEKKKEKEEKEKANEKKKQVQNHPNTHPQSKAPPKSSDHPQSTGKSRQQNSDASSSSISTSSPLSNMVFHSSKCSNPKATKERPNGCVSFLNCNIDGPGGWNPPPVTINHLKMLNLQELSKTEVFQPCKQYMEIFESVQNRFGIPGAILASIALQESSCSKTCKGPNGEIGLMQLTPENCKEFGVNPIDAWNVETNIILGAKQFKQALEEHGGNVIIALGYYNGWQKGMSESQARSKKYGCYAQNNLDYIDQMLNAWLQGKDGYSKEFQTYNNLAECG